MVAKLTGTYHGDAANQLFAFYQEQAQALANNDHFFMAAVALAMALEANVLAYLLVEFGEDNGGEIEIADSANMSQLLEIANELGVLSAPINIPSHLYDDGRRPKHLAKDVAEKIRKFRKLLHPARSIQQGFDPKEFTQSQYNEYEEMYESVLHSLLYYI